MPSHMHYSNNQSIITNASRLCVSLGVSRLFNFGIFRSFGTDAEPQEPYDQTSVIINLTPSVADVNGLVLFPGQGDRKSGLDPLPIPEVAGSSAP